MTLLGEIPSSVASAEIPGYLSVDPRYHTPGLDSPEYYDPQDIKPPLYDERERLPSGHILDIERDKVELNGGGVMPQIIYHAGLPVGRKQLEEVHRETYPNEKPIGDTMFDRIYVTAPDIPNPVLVDEELDLATRMGSELLEMGQTRPADVAALYVASGYPIVDDPRYSLYAHEVARRLGLTRVIDNNTAYEFFMACNSGGEAARDSLDWVRHPELQGKKVLRLNFEFLRRPIPGIVIPGRANALSSRMFSNGAAGELVIPGVTESILPDQNGLPLAVTDEEEDSKAFLGAIPSYQDMVNMSGPVRQSPRNNTVVARLPIPREGGYMIYMVPEAGVFFRRGSLAMIRPFIPTVEESYPDFEIAYANHHPASFTVWENLGGKLSTIAGINIPSTWYALDGNSSAASSTITKIRARRDEKIRPGLIIIDNTFGAGGIFTVKAQVDGDPRVIVPNYDRIIESFGAQIQR